MSDEKPEDYHCPFCDFKASTPTELWVHQCDGKRTQREAIRMGQQLGNQVGVSV